MLYSTTNGLNRWLYHVHLKITYLASLRVGFYMHQLGRFVHSGVSISLLILFVCLPVLIIKREVLKSSTVIEDLPFFFLFFSSTLPQIFWSSGITLLYLRDVSPFILLQWAYVSSPSFPPGVSILRLSGPLVNGARFVSLFYPFRHPLPSNGALARVPRGVITYGFAVKLTHMPFFILSPCSLFLLFSCLLFG